MWKTLVHGRVLNHAATYGPTEVKEQKQNWLVNWSTSGCLSLVCNPLCWLHNWFWWQASAKWEKILSTQRKNLHISSRVQIYAHVKHIISAWLFEYTPLVPKDPFKHTESFTSEGAQVVCNSDRSVWWAISWLRWLIVCVLISSLSVLWLNNGPRGVASRTGLWWYVSHVTNIFTIHSELLQSCDHIIVEISLI